MTVKPVKAQKPYPRSFTRHIHVLKALIKVQFSRATVYRFSFWTAFFGDLILFLVQLAVFGAIAKNGTIGGWTADHLTVFTGTFIALDGLYMTTYFFGIISLPDKIRTGTLDLLLIKPLNPLFQVTFGQFNLGTLALVPVGFGMAFWGAARLNALSFASAVRFTAVFLLMYVLMYALMLAFRCLGFWLTRLNAFNELENTMVEFSFRLPAPAIQGLWKLLLFIALPYGLMANLPAQALFGPFSLTEWLLGIGTTSVFLALSFLLWHKGLKRYDSASS